MGLNFIGPQHLTCTKVLVLEYKLLRSICSYKCDGAPSVVLHRLAREYPNLGLKDNMREDNTITGKFARMDVDIILLNVFGTLGWELVSSGNAWHVLKRRPM